MRKPPTSAFTLLEMLVVLAIIVILAGMVLSVGGYAQKKSALSRAAGELAMLSSACENYKSDNGNYPRDVPTTGKSVMPLLSIVWNASPISASGPSVRGSLLECTSAGSSARLVRLPRVVAARCFGKGLWPRDGKTRRRARDSRALTSHPARRSPNCHWTPGMRSA